MRKHARHIEKPGSIYLDAYFERNVMGRATNLGTKSSGLYFFLGGKYNGISLHLEYEWEVQEKHTLTSGLRLDYVILKPLMGQQQWGSRNSKTRDFSPKFA